MLAKRVIPCLDVKDGRVVKGIQFVDLIDAGDPVEVAKIYDEQGADELIFLDITASYEKRDIMLEVVRRTAETVFLPLTVGGGIKDVETIRTLLEAGTDKVSINTSAVDDPDLITRASKKFGSQCIVVAIDAKRVNPCDKEPVWEVFVHGGRTSTGLDAVKWAKEVVSRGAGEILLTSMDCDGTKDGYDIELTRAISDAVEVPVIASGGAGELKHLAEALTAGGASAALAASIFHFGEFTVSQAKEVIESYGVCVRKM